MRIRHWLYSLLCLLALSPAAPAQVSTTNTFNVIQFYSQLQGVTTVGAMTTAAQAQCNASTLIPCIIVFDPSLAAYATGSMPTRCLQCVWYDYRSANGVVITAPAQYGTSQTVTTTQNVGSSVTPAQYAFSSGVLLTCGQTGGVNCFEIHNGSTLGGLSTGSNSSRLGGTVINVASTANIANVVNASEGNISGGQSYFNLHDFQIDNASNGTVTNAMVNLAGVNGLSNITDVNVSQCGTTGFLVESSSNGVSGPLGLVNDWADCAYKTGGLPLHITVTGSKSQIGVSTYGGAWNHAGSGNPEIFDDGANTLGVLQSTAHFNSYVEDLSNTNAIGFKIKDAYSTSIFAGEAQLTQTGATAIDISDTTAGNTKGVFVAGFRCGGVSITCVNDHVTGYTSGTGGSTYIPLYVYGGSSGSQGSQPIVFDDVDFMLHNRAGNTTTYFHSGTGVWNFNYGFVAGASGAQVNTILKGSATLTYTSIAIQTCQEQSVTVTGATAGSAAYASPAASLGNTNLQWSAWVSSGNTVAVRVCNESSGAITPSAVTWNAWVVQ